MYRMTQSRRPLKLTDVNVQLSSDTSILLLMSFSHLDPVGGSRHRFSSISHSAPRGLLLAMCVSGGAHSACSPGHSLQCVSSLRQQTACAGNCPMWLHVSDLAVTSARHVNKCKERGISLKKERKNIYSIFFIIRQLLIVFTLSFLKQTSQNPRSVSMVTSSLCLSHLDMCLIQVMMLQQVTLSLTDKRRAQVKKKKKKPGEAYLK